MRTRPFLPLVALLGVLVGSLAPTPATAGQSDLAERCTRYRSELVRARVALEHGDRSEAVAALRKAQEELRTCARQDAQGVSVISALTSAPSAS